MPAPTIRKTKPTITDKMKSLFSKLRAIRQLPGFHSLVLKNPLKEYEIATMILSVVAYRRNIGPMTLFVDGPGFQWANKHGIADLYDEVFMLDPHPHIDSKVFWAAGKIEALSRMKAPCVSVDIDAVLFKRPPLMTDVVALHSEPESWEVYGRSAMRASIEKLVEKAVGVVDAPTHYPPANVGVLCINDEEFRMEYTRLAKHEMSVESLCPCMAPDAGIVIDGSPITQMVLAEQYLLSYLASATGKNLSFLGTLSLEDDHMEHNPDVVHLWNSKRFYAKHDRARQTYLSWCMENIYALSGDNRHAVSRAIHLCGLPMYRVNDGNTRSVRWSHKGEWTGPGESVEIFS